MIFAASVLAHHSAAMFDGTKLVVLKGSMLSFTNMNPHGWISVEAKVNGIGKSGRWDIESTSPGQLAANGIRSDTRGLAPVSLRQLHSPEAPDASLPLVLPLDRRSRYC